MSMLPQFFCYIKYVTLFNLKKVFIKFLITF